jgi:hypothetical protein
MKKTLAALMVVLAVPAFAQTEQEKKKIVHVQTLDFVEGSEIDGCLIRPDVLSYELVKRPGFKSLIKMRVNFDDKLRESVHQL